MSLPHFEEFGWSPTVLAVAPEYVEAAQDPLLLHSVPDSDRVKRVKALPAGYTRRLGLGNVGLRSMPYLRVAGDRLLKERGFDLVYFSTTMFSVMALGPYWRKRWGVPYVLDFQDPWLSDYYDSDGAPAPPGGHMKYGLSQVLARLLEPRAMRRVSHVISVSPAYARTLRARYPWVSEDQFTVLPFGAAESDFSWLAEDRVSQTVFNPEDGRRHWVYVGAAGPIMEKSLRMLFLAIRQGIESDPERYSSLCLHFVGTNYAPAASAVKTVEPIARELGVGALVEECTGRVPYFEALKILADSDGILLLGSDDPGYTASKLYPCILSRKPILALFHERSTVVDVMRRCNAGRVVTFADGDAPEHKLGVVGDGADWLLSLPKGYEPEIDWREFEPYTAREMTRRQCEVFEACVGAAEKGGSRGQ